ncbi:MAG: 50S ribosomal protein L29 [Candidatus Sungbacteria bacterium]|nr:50S ribosomal protein L29 [Candidatus Sungbacteria bacterium]
MKIAELRQRPKEELKSLLVEKRARIDEIGFMLRQKKTKNVKEAAGLRKDVARILTLINQKL